MAVALGDCFVLENNSSHQPAWGPRKGLCCFNLGVSCLSSCSDIAWCEWLSGKGKVSALKGQCRDNSGRDSQPLEGANRASGVWHFYLPTHWILLFAKEYPITGCLPGLQRTKKHFWASFHREVSVFNLVTSLGSPEGRTFPGCLRRLLSWGLHGQISGILWFRLFKFIFNKIQQENCRIPTDD